MKTKYSYCRFLIQSNHYWIPVQHPLISNIVEDNFHIHRIPADNETLKRIYFHNFRISLIAWTYFKHCRGYL